LTGVYFDAAYLVKCYVQDPDSERVRELVRSTEFVFSSALSIAEVACARHRMVREKTIGGDRAEFLTKTFSDDVSMGSFRLIPVSETILRIVETMMPKLPSSVYLRAGDAIHLATAQQEGFSEIWTNDRHMLRAAPHFGIVGSSV
jgi:predicted nucleic acid-binding protein